MATTTLLPDAMTSSSGIGGSFANIDEGVGSPDAAVVTMTFTGNYARVSFPTPPATLSTGAGLQTFRCRARRVGGSSLSMTIALREAGQLAISGGLSLGTSYSTVTFTWDAALLGTPDGSAVQCEFRPSAIGGGADLEVDAIDWIADYSEGQPAAKRFGGIPGMALIPGVW